MSRPVHASHADTALDAQLRAAQAEAILARERARDAQREAERPKPPAAPAKAASAPAKPPTPRRAVLPSSTPPPAPVIPPGHVLVEVDVLDALIETSSLTRRDRR